MPCSIWQIKKPYTTRLERNGRKECIFINYSIEVRHIYKGHCKSFTSKSLKQKLTEIYNCLFDAFGPQCWWPADTPFEVIVGAILTQNTSWKNVEKSIKKLKELDLLSPEKLHQIEQKILISAIKSSGFYNQKAKRLKNFIQFLFDEYKGNMKQMLFENGEDLRVKLLHINGIGPETADSILLYAAEKPYFVIDAYTKRILARHGFIEEKHKYHTVQQLFMENIEKKIQIYKEFHALLVKLGNTYCRVKPMCSECPLKTKN